MNKPEKLLLIDGAFAPNEAGEILMNILLSKIQFHKMKNFSSQERFGVDEENAKIRIRELQKTIKQLQKIIKSSEKKKENLQIKSEVSIRSKKI